MSTIILTLDDDIVGLLQRDDQPLDQVARELIVMDLYRRGMLSGGRAREILGMDLRVFMRRADDLGIPYFKYSADDLEAEWRTSQEL